MFQPAGDQAQWRTIYTHIQTLTVGDGVTDVTLAELLPDAAEGSWRSAFWRAVKQMEDDHQRSFDRVRKHGYRMVEAAEHERLARGQHKKAKRRIRSAIRKAHSADRTRLDQPGRQRLDAIEVNLSAQQDMIRRLSTKVEAIDANVKAGRREAKADAAVLSDKVDRLTALLERHGITEAAVKPS